MAYMQNLNTHRAYAGLRARRAEMRAKGERISGFELAKTLTSYSERGTAYVDSLHAIMRVNHLDPTDDDAYLSNGPTYYLVPVGEGAMSEVMKALSLVTALLVAGSAVAGDEAVCVDVPTRFGQDRHPSTSVRLELFDAHLEHLASAGYTVVPLAEVVACLKGDGATFRSERSPSPSTTPIRSVYTEAYPRLKARGLALHRLCGHRPRGPGALRLHDLGADAGDGRARRHVRQPRRLPRLDGRRAA